MTSVDRTTVRVPRSVDDNSDMIDIPVVELGVLVDSGRLSEHAVALAARRRERG